MFGSLSLRIWLSIRSKRQIFTPNSMKTSRVSLRWLTLTKNWRQRFFLDHLLGFRFHFNKPRKFGHWVELAAHVSELRLRKCFLNNFPLSRSVSSLKIDIFLLLFIWSFIKQVVISLPLKQMRRMLQEALRHGIIELVRLTVMYVIRYFQGI